MLTRALPRVSILARANARCISVGATAPNVTMKKVQNGEVSDTTTADAFKGKSVLIGLPGAFTPTCNDEHLPSFLKAADEIKAKVNL